MEVIAELPGKISQMGPARGGWAGARTSTGVVLCRASGSRRGGGSNSTAAAPVVLPLVPLASADDAAVLHRAPQAQPRATAGTGAGDLTNESSFVPSGIFLLSQGGSVVYQRPDGTLMPIRVPRGVAGIAGNSSVLVCWHPEGVNAYNVVDDFQTTSGPQLLGTATHPGLDKGVVFAALGPSQGRGGSSIFHVLKRVPAGFVLLTFVASSSSFTLAHKVDIASMGRQSAPAVLSTDPASGSAALVVFHDRSFVLARDGRVQAAGELGGDASPRQCALLTTTVAVAAQRKASALSLLTFALGASGAKRPTVAPELRASLLLRADQSSTSAEDCLVCPTSSQHVFVVLGGMIASCSLDRSQAVTAGVRKNDGPGAGNTLAAMMIAAATKAQGAEQEEEGSSARHKDNAELVELVSWITAADSQRTSFPRVVRDGAIRGGSTQHQAELHPLVRVVTAKCRGGPKVAAALTRYLAIAKDVSFATVFDIFAAVLTAFEVTEDVLSSVVKRGASDEHQQLVLSSSTLLTFTPAVADLLAVLRCRGLGSSAAAASAAARVGPLVAGALLEALYCVMLHAVQCGALAIATAAVDLVDGVLIAHAPTLCDRFPFVVRRIVPFIQHVGRWAMNDTGLRLGQLTAHCGPEARNAKEAAVVPPTPFAIKTTKPIHIRQEVVQLGRKAHRRKN